MRAANQDQSRTFNKDTGAAFGLIIGIILGSLLLNVKGEISELLASSGLDAAVRTATAIAVAGASRAGS